MPGERTCLLLPDSPDERGKNKCRRFVQIVHGKMDMLAGTMKIICWDHENYMLGP